MKKFIIHIICLAFLFSGSIFCQMPVVKISPEETYVNLNEMGEITIQVENVACLRAYSVRISFNSQMLCCVRVIKGTFFSGWNTFFYPHIDTIANYLQVDEAILGTGYEDGNGDLFKVQFFPRAEGDVYINFLNTDLKDTANNTFPVVTENGVIHCVNPTSISLIKENVSEITLVSYPNPFNSSTRIEFNSNNNEPTEFSIYSITGERVYFSEYKSQQGKTIYFDWNCKSNNGAVLPSGVYLLLAKNKNTFKSFKLIMLK